MLTDCRVLNAHLWWIGILNLLLAFLNRYSQICSCSYQHSDIWVLDSQHATVELCINSAWCFIQSILCWIQRTMLYCIQSILCCIQNTMLYTEYGALYRVRSCIQSSMLYTEHGAVYRVGCMLCTEYTMLYTEYYAVNYAGASMEEL